MLKQLFRYIPSITTNQDNNKINYKYYIVSATIQVI
jgi:hypothetical protein